MICDHEQWWFSPVRMSGRWSIVLQKAYLVAAWRLSDNSIVITLRLPDNLKSVITLISWLFIIRHNKRWSAIMRQRWFSPVRMSAKWSIVLPRGNCFAWSTWNFTIFLSSAVPVLCAASAVSHQNKHVWSCSQHHICWPPLKHFFKNQSRACTRNLDLRVQSVL